jgi:hypothetical protein
MVEVDGAGDRVVETRVDCGVQTMVWGSQIAVGWPAADRFGYEMIVRKVSRTF